MSSPYEHGYDYEPIHKTEAEEALAEMQARIVKAFLGKAAEEHEAIRAENARLREEIKETRALKADLDRKLREVERLKETGRAEGAKQFKEEKLQAFKELLGIVYATDWQWTYPVDKCDACDENRKTQFTSPAGKPLTEDCGVCGTRIQKLRVVEATAYKLAFDGQALIASVQYSFEGAYQRVEAKKSADGLPHEKVDQYEAYFTTREKAQAYCDYVNKKASA